MLQNCFKQFAFFEKNIPDKKDISSKRKSVSHNLRDENLDIISLVENKDRFLRRRSSEIKICFENYLISNDISEKNTLEKTIEKKISQMKRSIIGVSDIKQKDFFKNSMEN